MWSSPVMAVKGWHHGIATDASSAWTWTSAKPASLVSSRCLTYSIHHNTAHVISSYERHGFECVYFPGGTKPEGHEDDHEMVNMEYACDHCQGLIVGSRINCNVCEDFDLCFGCYSAKKYPDR